MLKKLFVTAAAAAAVSVPLAGVAWADPPSDPDSSSNPTNPKPNNPPGQGGVPQEIGSLADNYNVNPNPGEPITPGSAFNVAKDAVKRDPVTGKNIPGVSTPEAYGTFIDTFTAPLLGVPPWEGPTPPGQGVKTFTPGCSSGRHLNTTGGTSGGVGVCS